MGWITFCSGIQTKCSVLPPQKHFGNKIYQNYLLFEAISKKYIMTTTVVTQQDYEIKRKTSERHP